MDLETLAERFIDADEPERMALLTEQRDLGVLLAWQLKAHYDAIESANPGRAGAVALALTALATISRDQQVNAVAQWTAALVATDEGRLPDALLLFDASETHFRTQDQLFLVASTQVGKMRALVRALHPNFDAAGIAGHIVSTATDIGGAVPRRVYAARALGLNNAATLYLTVALR